MQSYLNTVLGPTITPDINKRTLEYGCEWSIKKAARIMTSYVKYAQLVISVSFIVCGLLLCR